VALVALRYGFVVARVVSRNSAVTLLRVSGLSLSAIVGAWDALRLLSAGEREPSVFDLASCPIIPLLRFLAAHANLSDELVVAILLVGNAATYLLLALVLIRFFERRTGATVDVGDHLPSYIAQDSPSGERLTRLRKQFADFLGFLFRRSVS
jgi:hypothetical protein